MNFEKIGKYEWEVTGENKFPVGMIIQWDRDYRIAKSRGAKSFESFLFQPHKGRVMSTRSLKKIFEFMEGLEIKLIQGEHNE